MSRTAIIVLVALAAALVGLAFFSTANRLRDEGAPPVASGPAPPQRAVLGWRETYGPAGERLVFRVEWLEVTETGWVARIGLENRTSVAFSVGDPRATLDRSFGLMLFASGELAELERRNARGALPAVRLARSFEPELPAVLEPGASWEGTISAPGALAGGSFVRVVFGALTAVGRVPEGLREQVVWITDSAHRLEP
ncbi:MAG: hypothetical protein RMM28_03110 [Thermoleophilia bacterium]|nr:hypothetical protein [Gaiellaceae bacterium]MDW8338109.1 hypothetical protein [Thermoleophilia bacterium]